MTAPDSSAATRSRLVAIVRRRRLNASAAPPSDRFIARRYNPYPDESWELSLFPLPV